MAETIVHKGTIIKILENGKLLVKLSDNASCSDCQIKNKCIAAKRRTDNVEVDVVCNRSLNVGDVVEITTAKNNMRLSIILAYIIPLFVLLFALVVLIVIFKIDDNLASLISLCLVVIYWYVLHVVSKRFDKVFKFELR